MSSTLGNNIYWIILILLFLYEMFQFFIAKKPGKRMEAKYTAESLKKYLVWAGIGSTFGCIGCVVFLLSALDIIKADLDIHDGGKAAWTAFVIWAVLIMGSYLIGHVQLKKKGQAAGGGKSSKNAEDEDF